MSTTDMSTAISTHVPGTGTVDMRLEVVVVPVSGVDRARVAYTGDLSPFHGWNKRGAASPSAA